MASHRMLLTLSDELHSIFKELSEATGQPAATLAVQFFEFSKDQLKATAEAAKLAKEGQSRAALKKMHQLVSEISDDIEEAQDDLQDKVDKK